MPSLDPWQHLRAALADLAARLRSARAPRPEMSAAEAARLAALAATASRLAAALPPAPGEIARPLATMVSRVRRAIGAALHPASRRPLAAALDRAERVLHRVERLGLEPPANLAKAVTVEEAASFEEDVAEAAFAGPHGPGGGPDD